MKRWFIICFVFISCGSFKTVPDFSLNKKIITFEKVRIKINANSFGNVTLNGYISLVKDSMLCFKFYGPFSYNVVSGVYVDLFKVNDNFHHVKYPNFDQNIFELTGFIVNRKVFESLVLGDLTGLQNEIIKINGRNVKIELNNWLGKWNLILTNNLDQRKYRIEFVMKNQMPKSISIFCKDSLTNWSSIIQNIYITNHSKKCNFEFGEN